VLTNSREQTELLEGAIKAIADADVADVTPIVDEDGVNNKLEMIKTYLAGLDSVDVTPTVNESAATNSGSDAKDKIEAAMDGTTAQVNTAVDENSLSGAVSKIADELGQSVDVTLNADQSIESIRSQIAEEIDVAIGSSKGAGFLESIDSLVDAIKTAVDKIEGKLPLRALSY
jgi:ribosome-associated translation inhibitor RaiA